MTLGNLPIVTEVIELSIALGDLGDFLEKCRMPGWAIRLFRWQLRIIRAERRSRGLLGRVRLGWVETVVRGQIAGAWGGMGGLSDLVISAGEDPNVPDGMMEEEAERRFVELLERLRRAIPIDDRVWVSGVGWVSFRRAG